MAKANELLNQTELQRLVFSEENYDEMIDRLEKVGRSTNLLFQGVPMAGDLNVLYQETLDRPKYCKQVFDLLYGEGSSPERLGRYVEFILANNLTNKWTFPTYLLYLCFPQNRRSLSSPLP